VFWHAAENPDMAGVEFDREDLVEFDVTLDEARNGQVRAKNMKYVAKHEKKPIPGLSASKKRKKEQWLKNWSSTPPPDWVCSYCGWKNFGRNKTCNFNNKNNQNCPGVRPAREEWPDTQHVKASEADRSDEFVQRALHNKRQAATTFGKEEDIPAGWHAEGASKDAHAAVDTARPSWPSQPPRRAADGHIPVAVLGEDPSLLEQGLPGAIAAKQLEEKESGSQAQGWSQAQAHPQVVMPPGSDGGYAAGAYGVWNPAWGNRGHADAGAGGGAWDAEWSSPARGGGGAGSSAGAAAGAAAAAAVPVPENPSQAALALCLEAFGNLASAPGPPPSEAQVAETVAEANQVLGDDRTAKHAFAMQLAKHWWIVQNGYEVRYAPGKNQVAVARALG